MSSIDLDSQNNYKDKIIKKRIIKGYTLSICLIIFSLIFGTIIQYFIQFLYENIIEFNITNTFWIIFSASLDPASIFQFPFVYQFDIGFQFLYWIMSVGSILMSFLTIVGFVILIVTIVGNIFFIFRKNNNSVEHC